MLTRSRADHKAVWDIFHPNRSFEEQEILCDLGGMDYVEAQTYYFTSVKISEFLNRDWLGINWFATDGDVLHLSMWRQNTAIMDWWMPNHTYNGNEFSKTKYTDVDDHLLNTIYNFVSSQRHRDGYKEEQVKRMEDIFKVERKFFDGTIPLEWSFENKW